MTARDNEWKLSRKNVRGNTETHLEMETDNMAISVNPVGKKSTVGGSDLHLPAVGDN